MSIIWAFDYIKSSLYRGEDCMKRFSSSLRENVTNIFNFETMKMLPLTKEELKLYQDAINCYICGKRISEKLAKVKIIGKLEIIVIIRVNYKGKEVQHIVIVI